MSKPTQKQIEAQAENMVRVMARIGAPVTIEEAKAKILASIEEGLCQEDRDEVAYRAHVAKVDGMMTLKGRSY